MQSRYAIRILTISALAAVLAVGGGWSLVHAQAPAPAKGVKFSQITPAELTEYLTYLSSDQLTGRQIYTEGYGLAAGYIQEH